MRNFFRYSIRSIMLLMFVVGAFLAGRNSTLPAIRRLEDRAGAAEIKLWQLNSRMSQNNAVLRDVSQQNSQLAERRKLMLAYLLRNLSPSFDVVKVVDGDTLKIFMDKERVVHLEGVDCSQGRLSSDVMELMTSPTYFKGPVWVVETDRDSNGDIIAVVIDSDGLILNDELVRDERGAPTNEHYSSIVTYGH